MADKMTIKPLPHQTDGVTIGETTTDKVGFHGSASAQRAHADQAAVVTTVGAALSALDGGESPTESEANDMIARINALRADVLALAKLANEMRTVLVGKGLMKGSAAE